VAGEPMIRRIIRWLAASAVMDLVLNLHHRPDTITAVVGDGGDLGVRVRYSWEQPTLLGSAGGPRLALPLVGEDPFLIVNGDTLTDVSLPGLAEAHAQSGALVTLALVPNREFDRYGGVRVDDAGRVTGFVPRGPAAEGSYHYIGVQIAAAEVFSAIPPGTAARTIGGAYDALMTSRPGAVRGYVTDVEFWDVGTVADYWRTSRAFETRGLGVSPHRRRAPRIDPTARVVGSILWDGVEIGPDAVVDACIVTDGVHIPAGATHRDEILTSTAP
jgi:mannose-1-phosphate guanylyltransferase